jgi:hypothetical protein
MLNGHHESAALVAAMHAPQLLRLSVHPRASAKTVFQLRSRTGRVLMSSTTHHDIVGCLATMHQTQK